MKRHHIFAILAFASLILTSKAAAGIIDVYASTSTDQTSFLAGVGGATTETFGTGGNSNLNSYTSTIGTFTSSGTFRIQGADQYGGAGGTGRYFVFGAQSGSASPVTITLTGSEDYLGMWLSAADANNGISFYNGTTLIGRFSSQSLLTLLGNTTVTAINGTVYQSSSYFGNPNNRTQDSGEPFVYLDFVAVGTTFNKIVLDNSGSTATGFESDNYTIYGSATVVPGTDVFVVAVPETPLYGILLCCLAFGLVGGHRLVQRFKSRLV
ncbi:MAG: hypothetical protein LV479_07930 [Methylacidiphilales bacterium]|nr:hypothetical protein [Candidatus Methylacidiphilales bacterium]